MSSSSDEQQNGSPVYFKKGQARSIREPTVGHSTLNVRDIRAQESFVDKKVDNQYSTLIAADINDPFLRASFEGDSVLLLQLQYQMKKNWVDSDEIWSKSLLAFILAVQSSQIKTANFFIQGNEKIRRIIQKLHIVFDQAHGYERRSPVSKLNEDQKQKVKVIVDSDDSNDEGEYNGNEKSKGQIIKLKSMEIEDHQKKVGKDQECSDSSNSDNLKETKHKTDKESCKSRNHNAKKNTEAGSDNKVNQPTKEYLNDSITSNDLVYIKQGSPFQHFQSNMHDIEKLQHILISDAALKFNTNILKIALNFEEDKVAAVIVANYPLQLELTTIEFAIQSQSMAFLQQSTIHQLLYSSMFYHNMNEIYDPNAVENNVTKEVKAASDSIVYFTLEDLMAKVHDFFTFKEAEAILQKILLWRIPNEENTLKFLVDLGHERVAVIFMDDYHQHSNWDFFQHCIAEEKQVFLKHALREQYFNLNYVYDQRLIEWALDEMKNGKNMLYPLNILLYSDFRKWEIENLKQIIQYQILIYQRVCKNNRVDPVSQPGNKCATDLYQSYHASWTHDIIPAVNKALQLFPNLICKWILDFNILDVECQRYLVKFEVLGRKIIQSISFDQVEIIFMDRDFKDRSVLSIICDNKIMSFIVINKLKFLINKIWDGKNSDMIDGKTSHYSRTKYLLYHEIKNIKGVPISIRDIMGDNFKPNSEDYNFLFQYKFRQQSIFIIFLKDFICATFIVCVFQYINYSYLNLFTERRYVNAGDYEAQLQILKNNLKTYNNFNFVGTILSVSYFFTFFYRLIYNSYSRRKIYGDIWMIFDLVSGTINIAAFNIIGFTTPEKLINPDTKRFYDYYMIVALIISWLRFFSYFLVLNIISKVTLTLFMMLKEALNFLIILGLYLVLMTTIFATLFRDTPTDDASDYHSLEKTARALIDYFLANYPQSKDMGNYNTSHSILVMVHITISNLFLLNFLIAILSTIYEIMIRNGDFYAIKYQYNFITKYMKSMEEDNGYHVLIQYPPPLNFLLIPLLFVFPSRQKTKRLSRCISQFFFWFENIFFVLCFFLYLFAHNPLIVVKIYYQILTKIDGIHYKILHLCLWTLTGLFTCIVVNIIDTGMLISILCAENSVVYDQSEDEKSKLLKLQYYIYRDIFRSMRQLHSISESTSFLFHKRQNLQRMFTQRMTITERMQNDFGDFKIDDLYIIRKELIIAVYEQISCQNPYILAFRRACYQFPNRKGSAAILNDLEVNVQEIKEREKEEPQMSPDLRTIIGKLILSHNRDNLSELIEFMQDERKRVNNKVMLITDQELRIIEKCIGRFTLQQKNQENTTINLQLVLKAIPKIFTKSSISQVELFNFQKIQKILITFFNDDQDEMFNYFDNRMNRRLIQLKRSSQKNTLLLDKILGISKNLFENSQMEEAMHKVATFHTLNGQSPPNNNGKKAVQQSNIRIEPLAPALTTSSNHNNPAKKNTSVSFQLNEAHTFNSQRDSLNVNAAEMLLMDGLGLGENTARQLEEVLMSDEPFEVMEFLMKEEKKALNRVLAYKQKQEQINQRSRMSNINVPNINESNLTGSSMTPSVQQVMPSINLSQAEMLPNTMIKNEEIVKSIKSNSNNLLPEFTAFEPLNQKKLQMQALAHLQTRLPSNMPTADQILSQIREKRKITKKETNLSNDDMNDVSYDDAASDFIESKTQKSNMNKINTGKASSHKGRKKAVNKSIEEDSFKSDIDESIEIQ